jgi:predicted enzyme related to lactoylglutathione lyase
MLGQAPIMAFVASTDLERSEAFYRGALGLTVEEINQFACVLRGGGTMLRVTLVESLTPHPFTVLGWSVTDIAGTIDALTANGVTFRRYDDMGQDERGIWTAPSGGRIAWFNDPDDNVLSLTEF